MSKSDPIPLKFELSSVADESRYYIHTRNEILSILRRMMEKKELAALYYEEGNHAILSQILDVQAAENSLVLDCSANAASNSLVEKSQKLVFISSLDNVKIQFIVPHLEKIEFEGRCAFSTPIPPALLRLQRREYFRLTASDERPLNCVIPFAGKKMTVNILNISAGGIAVIGYKDGFDLALDQIYHDCEISLPEVGQVTVSIEVRVTFDITMKNDVIKKRAGCRFLDMPPHAQTLIQRYIMKSELRKSSAG